MKKNVCKKVCFTNLFDNDEFPYKSILNFLKYRKDYKVLSFSYILAAHHMLFFYKEKINELISKENISDADFIYSAIAFCNIHEVFEKTMNKYGIKINFKFKRVVHDCIHIHCKINKDIEKLVDYLGYKITGPVYKEILFTRKLEEIKEKVNNNL